jgi:hypothetical protein
MDAPDDLGMPFQPMPTTGDLSSSSDEDTGPTHGYQQMDASAGTHDYELGGEMTTARRFLMCITGEPLDDENGDNAVAGAAAAQVVPDVTQGTLHGRVVRC